MPKDDKKWPYKRYWNASLGYYEDEIVPKDKASRVKSTPRKVAKHGVWEPNIKFFVQRWKNLAGYTSNDLIRHYWDYTFTWDDMVKLASRLRNGKVPGVPALKKLPRRSNAKETYKNFKADFADLL